MQLYYKISLSADLITPYFQVIDCDVNIVGGERVTSQCHDMQYDDRVT